MTIIFDDLTPKKSVQQKANKYKKTQTVAASGTFEHIESQSDNAENTNDFLTALGADSLAKHIIIGDIINNPRFKKRGR